MLLNDDEACMNIHIMSVAIAIGVLTDQLYEKNTRNMYILTKIYMTIYMKIYMTKNIYIQKIRKIQNSVREIWQRGGLSTNMGALFNLFPKPSADIKNKVRK